MTAARSVLAVLATAALVVTGCSSGGSPSGAHTTAGGAGGARTSGGAVTHAPGGGSSGKITFHAEASFTGAYTFTDSYDVVFDPSDYAEDDSSAAVPKSCTDIAKLGTSAGGSGEPPSFEVPTPDGTMASGKNYLGFQADVDSYTGPKTYSGQEVDSSAGMEISNTPEPPDNGGGDLTFNDAPANSSITVNADGSGKLSIAGWEDAGSRTVSGTVAWTCSG